MIISCCKAKALTPLSTDIYPYFCANYRSLHEFFFSHEAVFIIVS